jgi:hypothetical protein
LRRHLLQRVCSGDEYRVDYDISGGTITITFGMMIRLPEMMILGSPKKDGDFPHLHRLAIFVFLSVCPRQTKHLASARTLLLLKRKCPVELATSPLPHRQERDRDETFSLCFVSS